MKKWVGSFSILASVLTVILFLLLFTSNGTEKKRPEPEKIEITEYMGVKLDDASAFRENSIKGVQYLEEDSYTLSLDGLVKNRIEFKYAELGDFDRIEKQVTLHCVEGWTARVLWEGIPLSQLLNRAEPLAEANTLIFHSHDGYTTSLPLEYILERNIIIADKMNGLTLPPAQGFPFILVAEEKWGYKWARWITRIELSSDFSYRGFWEIKGYNNIGDLSGPISEDYVQEPTGAPRGEQMK